MDVVEVVPLWNEVPDEMLERYLGKLFRIGDAKGCGVLQPKEFVELLTRAGLRFPPSLVQKLFLAAGVNKEGVIEYDGIMPAMLSLIATAKESNMVDDDSYELQQRVGNQAARVEQIPAAAAPGRVVLDKENYPHWPHGLPSWYYAELMGAQPRVIPLQTTTSSPTVAPNALGAVGEEESAVHAQGAQAEGSDEVVAVNGSTCSEQGHWREAASLALVEQLQAQVQKDDVQLEAMKAELSGTQPIRAAVDSFSREGAEQEARDQLQALTLAKEKSRERDRYCGVSVKRTAKFRWLDDPSVTSHASTSAAGTDCKLLADAKKERAARPYLCWNDAYDPTKPVDLGVVEAGAEPVWARPLQAFAKRLDWADGKISHKGARIFWQKMYEGCNPNGDTWMMVDRVMAKKTKPMGDSYAEFENWVMLDAEIASQWSNMAATIEERRASEICHAHVAQVRKEEDALEQVEEAKIREANALIENNRDMRRAKLKLKAAEKRLAQLHLERKTRSLRQDFREEKMSLVEPMEKMQKKKRNRSRKKGASKGMQGQMDLEKQNKECLVAAHEAQLVREEEAQAAQEREEELALAEFEELDFEAELAAAKLEMGLQRQ